MKQNLRKAVGIRCLLVIYSTLNTAFVYAAFEGQISFSQAEKDLHLRNVRTLEATTSRCLQDTLAHHREFYAQYGISPYYGDRSRFGLGNWAYKKAEIRARGLPLEILDQLKPTSCVGLVLKCMGQGFEQTGQKQVWERIKKFVLLNNQDGMALQSSLQQLGWKILYWNPLPARNKIWDQKERRKDPANRKKFWGYHESNYLSVTRKGVYLSLKVDDRESMVGFEKNPPSAFQRASLFLGVAHGGYHVFPGFLGQVVEAHSTREIDDPETVESAPFNPLEIGGAPRGQYFSGVLVVAPGAMEF